MQCSYLSRSKTPRSKGSTNFILHFMETDKITYLLGAGASANRIPVVEAFNGVLSGFIQYINKLSLPDRKYTGDNSEIPVTKSMLKDRFIHEANELYREIISHASIDTYARKLHLLRADQKLRRLKALTSIFLIFRHITEGYDIRYDIFLATVLGLDTNKTDIILPQKMQILTWNYDFQLEMAAANFFRNNSITKVQELLNINPRQSKIQIDQDSNFFSVIKLNGSASGYLDNDKYRPMEFSLALIDKNNLEEITGLIEELLSYYYWFTFPPSSATSNIMYAWEKDSQPSQLRDFATKKIIDTTVLVIIGYSFPTFNRQVDKALLKEMPLLKNVYIQAKSKSIKGIYDRFVALLGRDRLKEIEAPHLIEVKKNDEEFYIPFQFTGA